MSRRRQARRPAQQAVLPDWVWGLGIGVVALVVIGVIVLVTGVATGGGGSGCAQPLKALGSSDVSAAGFTQEDAGMGKMLTALSANDRNGADAAFYGDVHNFTHNADPPIRAKNPQLAQNLCQAVLDLEDILVSPPSAQAVIPKAQRVRDLLRDGAVALGYPRPGS